MGGESRKRLGSHKGNSSSISEGSGSVDSTMMHGKPRKQSVPTELVRLSPLSSFSKDQSITTMASTFAV